MDYLSLSGDGYIASIYKKYGKVVSLMGCRASLSPWYERGGMHPADENDVPIFEGRCNLGAISLHLPMILQKSRQECKDFYEVLDYYLELIRKLHKRTYASLAEKLASTNPIQFMQGGLLNGNLKANEKIGELLRPMTMSFGVTALNELQVLYNGKSIYEDGEFALEVMKYINKKINEFKEEDNILYACYGTPAEQLCLAPDTEVQTYEGIKMIKDITTNDLVYSFNEKLHKIELKRVLFAGKTGINRQVVRVTTDNGQTVVCTPNHPFAVRNIARNDKGQCEGEYISYIEAGSLMPGMRIKSNYIRTIKERPCCSIHYNGKVQYIQDINAEYFLGPKPNGYVLHHKDQNKMNNFYENLQYMTDADHRRYHMKDTIKSYCYTTESQTGSNNNFYGKHHTEESKLANRKAHLDPNKSIYCIPNNDSLPIRFYPCANDAEKAGYTRNLVKRACCGEYIGEDGHKYNDSTWIYKNESSNNVYDTRAKSIIDNGDITMATFNDELNHKVIKVEWLQNPMDVYDITVEDNHNFFVGGVGGMLVHNCGLQIEQFRAKYGVINGVSSREYVSNSFHCGVWEDITPIEKQDSENRFWDLFNGGKIQYCRYPINYNTEAMKTLVRRAMSYGFYEGINEQLSYCDDCGHEELEMTEKCSSCSSENLTIEDRMNGYIGYTKVKGKPRFNKAKLIEIKERKSM